MYHSVYPLEAFWRLPLCVCTSTSSRRPGEDVSGLIYHCLPCYLEAPSVTGSGDTWQPASSSHLPVCLHRDGGTGMLGACLASYMCVGNLNSGPYACTISILLQRAKFPVPTSNFGAMLTELGKFYVNFLWECKTLFLHNA